MIKDNRYISIIKAIFLSKFRLGMREVGFERQDIEKFARKLKLALPKNLGDLVYSFRYRTQLPAEIYSTAGQGETWIIRPAGRAKYRFVLIAENPLIPNLNLTITKIPDSTPGVISKYALSDEQALLARLRYNRLIDIFTGVTCYSLQNHLRTTAPNMGQVETDEVYVGVDKKGANYVLPTQAKAGKDKLSVVQIEQDIAMCAAKFPLLICRPIAAQFLQEDVIALFELENGEDGIRIVSEKHYKLVPPEEVTEADLQNYRTRPSE
ncbi:MAG: endonuclease [Acidobacteriia bacterium]|nr:endonuclease [Terriglobia bacterium]